MKKEITYDQKIYTDIAILTVVTELSIDGATAEKNTFIVINELLLSELSTANVKRLINILADTIAIAEKMNDDIEIVTGEA